MTTQTITKPARQFQAPEHGLLPQYKLDRMQNAQYRLVGHHSAVKICHWCKIGLRGEGSCYKDTFYGIDTNRCLEMSPAILCNQRCSYCWRDTAIFAPKWKGIIDNPKFILEESLKVRKELLIGFRGNKEIDQKLLEQSMNPNHAAISLTGEPCMYPRLHELVDEFFKQDFKTVYVVTSGTVPEMLEKFYVYPTNLYISLDSTNKKEHIEICKPVIKDSWEKLNESLDLMRTKFRGKTRRILRITVIRGLNDSKPEAFVPLIEKAQPDFVEVKSYMWIGYSRGRLGKENMPEHKEVQAFAKKIEENSKYKIHDERTDSRVVLLKRN